MGSDLPLEAETEVKDGLQTPTYPSYATQHGSGLSTASFGHRLVIACLSDPVASSIGPTQEAGTAYFNISGTQYLLSNTGLMLGIAFAPMALNPLSELLGRVKTFGISMSIYTLLFIPQTLTKSYAGFVISRLLIGVFGSVASSMIAGTLVDMYGSKTRGRAMNAFTLSIFIGQGVGPAIAAHIAEKTDYRWVWGYQGIASAVGLAWYLSVAKETRPSLPPVEFDDGSHAVSKRWRHLLDAISVSISRPFVYLTTEPIVIALSLWVGFAWGVIFLFASSVFVVFGSYGFSVSECSLFLIPVAIGGCLASVASLHQDHIYSRASRRASPAKAAPEARLHHPCVGGVMLAAGLWFYAWTARPSIHWIVPGIALVIVNAGTFSIYLGVYSYLSDAYEHFSSSANASQSFVRNVLGAVFPLFARRLYQALGPPQAGSIVAAFATILAAVPFLLVRYGAVLRARSRATSEIQALLKS
ncbi:hypothetical protein FFLO_03643 [Filobasidium floriforme]|uniref:Major facilitator superfamily (MFS) profile domain-containing protein n=1 Tax=Filobasidium floriforme TaxID=5210 RepID=A0A8K0NQ26_9TREE|nr:hypothetical protein FFLO_03643 [Filobasidium floriforme]